MDWRLNNILASESQNVSKFYYLVCLYMFKLTKFNNYWLSKAKILLVILVLALNMPIKEVSATWDYKDIAVLVNNGPEIRENQFLVTGGDSLMSANTPPEQQRTISVILTAYSSTPDQTDDTPFTTASNTRVRDGIVAANFLAFGTKIKIPSIFGDKVFTVEDRMAKKHSDKIDIWFPERHLAKRFGVKKAEITVLE